MNIHHIFTEQTCGEACWEAREDVCRCSCGGKNHGILRTANGKRPERTAKIDGHRYKLAGISTEYGTLWSEANTINRAAGCASEIYVSPELTYHYHWKETDTGAPARLKPASKQQRASWSELEAYRDMPAYKILYLLWIKTEQQVPGQQPVPSFVPDHSPIPIPTAPSAGIQAALF